MNALAFDQCGPGLISRLGVICGLSLLVLFSAPKGFSPGSPVFPSPQKAIFEFELISLVSPIIERFHMTSRQPCWCSKTKAAMMVYQTNPPGIELYFYANAFLCFSNTIWMLVT